MFDDLLESVVVGVMLFGAMAILSTTPTSTGEIVAKIVCGFLQCVVAGFHIVVNTRRHRSVSSQTSTNMPSAK